MYHPDQHPNRSETNLPDAQLRRRGEKTLKLVQKMYADPSPLLSILEAPPHDPDAVTRALEQSSPLGARVLSVTNSAAIGVVGEISDIHRAVIHMGASRARSIALAFGMQLLTEQAGVDAQLTRDLWVNSLEKAYMAQLVAKALDPGQVDCAYSFGLIQDIGVCALAAIDPAFYQGSTDQDKDVPLSQREQQHFGVDHAEVGHHLLSKWNASPTLCEEVLHHHQPLLTQTEYSTASLASQIAGMLPHDCETMNDGALEWLTAALAQFLASTYETPESLIREATQAAKQIHCGAPSVTLAPGLIQRMATEVANDTAGMVHRLWETESLLSRKHEQVNVLRFEAITDPLTQLLNRRGFLRMAERRLNAAIERELPVCAITIDMDDFKLVNDTHGHDAGDHVLTEFARNLKETLTSSDLVSRLGGDEFAIFLINVDQLNVQRIVKRITDTCMDKTVTLRDGRKVAIYFSIGAATCENPTSKTLVADLLSASDEAMYQCKKSGSQEAAITEFPRHKKAS